MKDITRDGDEITIEQENGNIFVFDVPVVHVDKNGPQVEYGIPQTSGEVYVYPRRVQYVGGGPLTEIYLEPEEMEVLENLLEKFEHVEEIDPTT